MKQAVIDIGSNSMRLTVFGVEGDSFRILFRAKIMAGLAGYVEDGRLSDEGIARACSGLCEFKETVSALDIDDVTVFATASLRNIENSKEAVESIQSATGLAVDVISGEQEALLGFDGAMCELSLDEGAFVDIGGASTEITLFAQGKPDCATSIGIGSLSLYKQYVKKVLPKEEELKQMRKAAQNALAAVKCEKRQKLVCVGGTARAVLKLAKKVYALADDCNTVTYAQLKGLLKLLCGSKQEAAELILKLEPDRIHTMIPGMLIMRRIAGQLGAREIIVSKYGVREGYLHSRILA